MKIGANEVTIGESFSWFRDNDGDVREMLGVNEDGVIVVAEKGLNAEQEARWSRILGGN